MSNTLIQIKRSTTTAVPNGGTLSAGELAYSYQSNTTFIGTSDGTGVLPIGGKFYVDKTNTSYDIAVAAFDKANTGDTLVITAAFDKANSANYYAYLVDQNAAAAFSFANTVYSNYAYPAYINASNAYDKANSANLLAYNTGIGANAFTAATIAGANTAVGTGANNYSNATFVKLTAADQTITGNIAITGKLVVTGNVQFLDTESLKIGDSLIYLAGNNYSSDIVDIGFIANYNNGSANLHTGLYREHTNKEYYLFQEYTEEPFNNHIDPTANGFNLSVLNAAIRTSNLNLGGANAIPWITAAFDKANSATSLAFNTIVANGVSLLADSNNDTLTITQSNGIIITGNAGADSFDISLSATGVTPSSYGAADKVGTFVVDSYGRLTAAGNVNIAIDAAAITSGILGVPRGGTGLNTITQNGILYGNTTGALQVTSAGTEGQVLQASSTGIPSFGMLDGGSF